MIRSGQELGTNPNASVAGRGRGARKVVSEEESQDLGGGRG